MAYTPDYTSGDLSTSIISTIVTIVLVLGAFAAIIALVVLWRFLSGKKLM